MPIIAHCRVCDHKNFRNKSIPVLTPIEDCFCPFCKKGFLVNRDHIPRHYKEINEEQGIVEEKWVFLPRVKCLNPDCGHIVRVLPKAILPFKHYCAKVIQDVLDGKLNEESTNDFPAACTMERWRTWFEGNKTAIEAQIRGNAYSLQDYEPEILVSEEPLLCRIMARFSNWLHTIIRLLYNAGCHLDSQPAAYAPG